ncbi:hypothetical protein STSO111631_19430 [Stackebrandtia soli]
MGPVTAPRSAFMTVVVQFETDRGGDDLGCRLDRVVSRIDAVPSVVLAFARRHVIPGSGDVCVTVDAPTPAAAITTANDITAPILADELGPTVAANRWRLVLHHGTGPRSWADVLTALGGLRPPTTTI